MTNAVSKRNILILGLALAFALFALTLSACSPAKQDTANSAPATQQAPSAESGSAEAGNNAQNNTQNNAQDNTQNNAQNNAQPSGISLDEAKDIALKDAGISAADATFVKTETDLDDAVKKYELEFVSGQNKYEYDVRMDTGDILKKEIESVYDD